MGQDTAKPEMANVGFILVTLTIMQQCTVACIGQDTTKPEIANVWSILQVTFTILKNNVPLLHGTGHSKTRKCKCMVNAGNIRYPEIMYRCLVHTEKLRHHEKR